MNRQFRTGNINDCQICKKMLISLHNKKNANSNITTLIFKTWPQNDLAPLPSEVSLSLKSEVCKFLIIRIQPRCCCDPLAGANHLVLPLGTQTPCCEEAHAFQGRGLCEQEPRASSTCQVWEYASLDGHPPALVVPGI